MKLDSGTAILSLIGLVACLIYGIGYYMGGAETKTEAVKRGYAHWKPADNGVVKFVWVEKD